LQTRHNGGGCGVRLFAYEGKKKWGEWLCDAVREQGGETSVFRSAREVPDSEDVVVYLPLNHHPKYRKRGKRAAEAIALKKRVLMIPRIHECRLYDDKILQSKLFQGWMPLTHVVTSPCEARTVLEFYSYPFISKASQGAASSNVRLIRDEGQAMEEIRAAFSLRGIRCHFKVRQKGYLLWQQFLPDNDFDWRIIILGRSRRWVKPLKRFNRPGTVFASGSHRSEEVMELTDEAAEVMDYSLKFAEAFDLTHTALDILRDEAGKFQIVENTTIWERFKRSRNFPSEAPFFERTDKGWEPSKYMGGDFFELMTEMMLKGCFR